MVASIPIKRGPAFGYMTGVGRSGVLDLGRSEGRGVIFDLLLVTWYFSGSLF